MKDGNQKASDPESDSPAVLSNELLASVNSLVIVNINGVAGTWWQGSPCRHVGALTPQIAKHLSQPVSRIRRQLHQLARKGLLESHRTPGGSTRWVTTVKAANADLKHSPK